MQISILGLGWLGLPLAEALRQNNHDIKGSVTSSEKLATLKENNYNAFQVFFKEEKIEGDIEKCLEGSRVLVLNTPPGLRRNPSSSYVSKIEKLLPYIETSSVEKVLFVGSTTVFKESEGFPVIINKTEPNAVSNSGVQLHKVEQLLLNNSHFETTVLRFAGLVDECRHPATMMSKRKEIPNPKAPVNLIHREDCIGIIKAIIKQEKWGEVFNAAYPLHPEKKSYYDEICALKKIPKPDFSYKNTNLGKVINGNDTSSALNYDYKHLI